MLENQGGNPFLTFLGGLARGALQVPGVREGLAVFGLLTRPLSLPSEWAVGSWAKKRAARAETFPLDPLLDPEWRQNRVRFRDGRVEVQVPKWFVYRAPTEYFFRHWLPSKLGLSDDDQTWVDIGTYIGQARKLSRITPRTSALEAYEVTRAEDFWHDMWDTSISDPLFVVDLALALFTGGTAALAKKGGQFLLRASAREAELAAASAAGRAASRDLLGDLFLRYRPVIEATTRSFESANQAASLLGWGWEAYNRFALLPFRPLIWLPKQALKRLGLLERTAAGEAYVRAREVKEAIRRWQADDFDVAVLTTPKGPGTATVTFVFAKPDGQGGFHQLGSQDLYRFEQAVIQGFRSFGLNQPKVELDPAGVQGLAHFELPEDKVQDLQDLLVNFMGGQAPPPPGVATPPPPPAGPAGQPAGSPPGGPSGFVLHGSAFQAQAQPPSWNLPGQPGPSQPPQASPAPSPPPPPPATPPASPAAAPAQQAPPPPPPPAAAPPLQRGHWDWWDTADPVVVSQSGIVTPRTFAVSPSQPEFYLLYEGEPGTPPIFSDPVEPWAFGDWRKVLGGQLPQFTDPTSTFMPRELRYGRLLSPVKALVDQPEWVHLDIAPAFVDVLNVPADMAGAPAHQAWQAKAQEAIEAAQELVRAAERALVDLGRDPEELWRLPAPAPWYATAPDRPTGFWVRPWIKGTDVELWTVAADPNLGAPRLVAFLPFQTPAKRVVNGQAYPTYLTAVVVLPREGEPSFFVFRRGFADMLQAVQHARQNLFVELTEARLASLHNLRSQANEVLSVAERLGLDWDSLSSAERRRLARNVLLARDWALEHLSPEEDPTTGAIVRRLPSGRELLEGEGMLLRLHELDEAELRQLLDEVDRWAGTVAQQGELDRYLDPAYLDFLLDTIQSSPHQLLAEPVPRLAPPFHPGFTGPQAPTRSQERRAKERLPEDEAFYRDWKERLQRWTPLLRSASPLFGGQDQGERLVEPLVPWGYLPNWGRASGAAPALVVPPGALGRTLAALSVQDDRLAQALERLLPQKEGAYAVSLTQEELGQLGVDPALWPSGITVVGASDWRGLDIQLDDLLRADPGQSRLLAVLNSRELPEEDQSRLAFLVVKNALARLEKGKVGLLLNILPGQDSPVLSPVTRAVFAIPEEVFRAERELAEAVADFADLFPGIERSARTVWLVWTYESGWDQFPPRLLRDKELQDFFVRLSFRVPAPDLLLVPYLFENAPFPQAVREQRWLEAEALAKTDKRRYLLVALAERLRDPDELQRTLSLLELAPEGVASPVSSPRRIGVLPYEEPRPHDGHLLDWLWRYFDGKRQALGENYSFQAAYEELVQEMRQKAPDVFGAPPAQVVRPDLPGEVARAPETKPLTLALVGPKRGWVQDESYQALLSSTLTQLPAGATVLVATPEEQQAVQQLLPQLAPSAQVTVSGLDQLRQADAVLVFSGGLMDPDQFTLAERLGRLGLPTFWVETPDTVSYALERLQGQLQREREALFLVFRAGQALPEGAVRVVPGWQRRETRGKQLVEVVQPGEVRFEEGEVVAGLPSYRLPPEERARLLRQVLEQLVENRPGSLFVFPTGVDVNDLARAVEGLDLKGGRIAMLAASESQERVLRDRLRALTGQAAYRSLSPEEAAALATTAVRAAFALAEGETEPLRRLLESQGYKVVTSQLGLQVFRDGAAVTFLTASSRPLTTLAQVEALLRPAVSLDDQALRAYIRAKRQAWVQGRRFRLGLGRQEAGRLATPQGVAAPLAGRDVTSLSFRMADTALSLLEDLRRLRLEAARQDLTASFRGGFDDYDFLVQRQEGGLDTFVIRARLRPANTGRPHIDRRRERAEAYFIASSEQGTLPPEVTIDVAEKDGKRRVVLSFSLPARLLEEAPAEALERTVDFLALLYRHGIGDEGVYRPSERVRLGALRSFQQLVDQLPPTDPLRAHVETLAERWTQARSSAEELAAAEAALVEETQREELGQFADLSKASLRELLERSDELSPEQLSRSLFLRRRSSDWFDAANRPKVEQALQAVRTETGIDPVSALARAALGDYRDVLLLLLRSGQPVVLEPGGLAVQVGKELVRFGRADLADPEVLFRVLFPYLGPAAVRDLTQQAEERVRVALGQLGRSGVIEQVSLSDLERAGVLAIERQASQARQEGTATFLAGRKVGPPQGSQTVAVYRIRQEMAEAAPGKPVTLGYLAKALREAREGGQALLADLVRRFFPGGRLEQAAGGVLRVVRRPHLERVGDEYRFVAEEAREWVESLAREVEKGLDALDRGDRATAVSSLAQVAARLERYDPPLTETLRSLAEDPATPPDRLEEGFLSALQRLTDAAEALRDLSPASFARLAAEEALDDLLDQAAQRVRAFERFVSEYLATGADEATRVNELLRTAEESVRNLEEAMSRETDPVIRASYQSALEVARGEVDLYRQAMDEIGARAAGKPDLVQRLEAVRSLEREIHDRLAEARRSVQETSDFLRSWLGSYAAFLDRTEPPDQPFLLEEVLREKGNPRALFIAQIRDWLDRQWRGSQRHLGVKEVWGKLTEAERQELRERFFRDPELRQLVEAEQDPSIWWSFLKDTAVGRFLSLTEGRELDTATARILGGFYAAIGLRQLEQALRAGDLVRAGRWIESLRDLVYVLPPHTLLSPGGGVPFRFVVSPDEFDLRLRSGIESVRSFVDAVRQLQEERDLLAREVEQAKETLEVETGFRSLEELDQEATRRRAALDELRQALTEYVEARSRGEDGEAAAKKAIELATRFDLLDEGEIGFFLDEVDRAFAAEGLGSGTVVLEAPDPETFVRSLLALWFGPEPADEVAEYLDRAAQLGEWTPSPVERAARRLTSPAPEPPAQAASGEALPAPPKVLDGIGKRERQRPWYPDGEEPLRAGDLVMDEASLAQADRFVLNVRDARDRAALERALRSGRVVYVGRDITYKGVELRDRGFGNPFKLAKDQDTDQGRLALLRRYLTEHLLRRPDLLWRARRELRGKLLLDWCTPELCHAHILSWIANVVPEEAFQALLRQAREQAKPLRVLIAGSRLSHWPEDLRPLVREKIERLIASLPPGSTIIEGEASGVDTWARQAAEKLGYPVQPFPADWDRYGKAAGPIRNKQMLEEGKPDIVIGITPFELSRSRGTQNMLTQARQAGVLTFHFLAEDEFVLPFLTDQVPSGTTLPVGTEDLEPAPSVQLPSEEFVSFLTDLRQALQARLEQLERLREAAEEERIVPAGVELDLQVNAERYERGLDFLDELEDALRRPGPVTFRRPRVSLDQRLAWFSRDLERLFPGLVVEPLQAERGEAVLRFQVSTGSGQEAQVAVDLSDPFTAYQALREAGYRLGLAELAGMTPQEFSSRVWASLMALTVDVGKGQRVRRFLAEKLARDLTNLVFLALRPLEVERFATLPTKVGLRVRLSDELENRLLRWTFPSSEINLTQEAGIPAPSSGAAFKKAASWLEQFLAENTEGSFQVLRRFYERTAEVLRSLGVEDLGAPEVRQELNRAVEQTLKGLCSGGSLL